MRPLPLVAPLLILLLSACSATREDLSFDACAASAQDATQRSRTYSDSQKTSFKIDEAASRASTQSIEADARPARTSCAGRASAKARNCRT